MFNFSNLPSNIVNKLLPQVGQFATINNIPHHKINPLNGQYPQRPIIPPFPVLKSIVPTLTHKFTQPSNIPHSHHFPAQSVSLRHLTIVFLDEIIDKGGDLRGILKELGVISVGVGQFVADHLFYV